MGSPKASRTVLGARLRQARESKGLTQAEAAEALGVGQSTLSDWETGESRPRDETIRHVLEVLGVPRDEWREVLAADLLDDVADDEPVVAEA